MYRKSATLTLKVVVSPVEVKDILRQFHTSAMGGHSGINSTMNKIVVHYWWHCMKADVTEYVSHCFSYTIRLLMLILLVSYILVYNFSGDMLSQVSAL